MSAGQWAGGVAATFMLPCSLTAVQGAFWEAVCWAAPEHWHCAPPFPGLSLAWGIAKFNMCELRKWVSSASWKSRLVTHFLHIEHIIFRLLFTMGSLSLGEKEEAGIVCTKAKQKKKKRNGNLLLKDAWNGRGKKGCYYSNVNEFQMP